jgi:hypothetical protein
VDALGSSGWVKTPVYSDRFNWCFHYLLFDITEMFENAKDIIRSLKSKDAHYTYQQIKDKTTNNCGQNDTQKTKDWVTGTKPKKPRVNSSFSEEQVVPSLVVHGVIIITNLQNGNVTTTNATYQWSSMTEPVTVNQVMMPVVRLSKS